jgi:hypothetical protein
MNRNRKGTMEIDNLKLISTSAYVSCIGCCPLEVVLVIAACSQSIEKYVVTDISGLTTKHGRKMERGEKTAEEKAERLACPRSH